MVSVPDRSKLATTSPVPTWAEHFAEFGKLYDFLFAMAGAQAPQERTIASGALTAGQAPERAFIQIDTESDAASDDLDTIAVDNLVDGMLLICSLTPAGRTVVFKHGSGGTGQLLLNDSADFTMNDPTMVLVLRRDGNDWRELIRFYGQGKGQHRTFYGAAGVADDNAFSGINTFSKVQKWAKGADVASATTLAIGNDGNYFDVTGAVAISAIASKGVGTRIRLHFDSTPQLVHSANLYLPGATNIDCAVADEMEFIEYATGQWRLTSLLTNQMTQAEAEAGTGSKPRMISAAVLKAGILEHAAGGSFTVMTPLDLTGQSNATFTGIPAGVREILVFLESADPNTTPDTLLRLGDSGGVETTGYVHREKILTTSVADSAFTNGFGFKTDSTLYNLTGLVRLTKREDHVWHEDHAVNYGYSTYSSWGEGYKALSGELTQVQLILASSTWTSGYVHCHYR